MANGTAVALLRYADLTPEEHEAAVAVLDPADERITRVPAEVVAAARALYAEAVGPDWERPAGDGRFETRWDPLLGVHGCDHGGGDDLGRLALRAVGRAVHGLHERPDHAEGSALLDALRQHTAQHDELPLPPTVAGWFQGRAAAPSGTPTHQALAQALAPLYWLAHLLGDPAGDAPRHVVALARVLLRERWDARWLVAALPAVAAALDGGDARWLAQVALASRGAPLAGQAVVREVRRVLGGPALSAGVARWRTGLEDGLRQAPGGPSALPGLPAVTWSQHVVVPLLLAAQPPPPRVTLVDLVDRLVPDRRWVDGNTPHLALATWLWLRRPGRLAGWWCSDPEVRTAACDAFGPAFAELVLTRPEDGPEGAGALLLADPGAAVPAWAAAGPVTTVALADGPEGASGGAWECVAPGVYVAHGRGG